jgi:hypothetical protein
MKKSVVFFFVLLLLSGPAAPLWAEGGEDLCARGHHDVMTKAMQSCHEAPCCAMVEPHRDGNTTTRRLERSSSVILDSATVAMTPPTTRGDVFAYGAAPPVADTSHSTPVLRC